MERAKRSYLYATSKGYSKDEKSLNLNYLKETAKKEYSRKENYIPKKEKEIER
ncbi:hypothetical protein [Bulleidia sp. zg-1006]|uniref:hypothetical protein n=1 Tax=Bulleidia sp. zg-1006 TaxID=2806552 RepID=UPI001939F7C5|nr:hypothetical protein [Bulleidia sp. zg-1006]QRG86064.1 hypothetical protein JOS54_04105 [Bulleidia sp. zg-1006]